MDRATKKTVLAIIDGWGHNETARDGDAIARTSPRWMTRLSHMHPSFLLHAHGEHVGLPKDAMGNSEVGHLTIGAGRIVPQDITRIDNSIRNGDLDTILKGCVELRAPKVHLVGLLSEGGVHSHINHIKYLINKVPCDEIFLHLILDGRDSEPNVACRYVREIQSYCNNIKKGRIASISGRFYSMDRDCNYERTDEAYEMMTSGDVVGNTDPVQVIRESYAMGLTDEFVKPKLVNSKGSVSVNEPILFANFRADRMKQIVSKFAKSNFFCYTMTFCVEGNRIVPLFKKENVVNTLVQVLAKNNLKQMHIAETEKYAHVTYFLNGRKEEPEINEDRKMFHSHKVNSFDEKPVMRTIEIANAVIDSIKDKNMDFVVCNFAAPDMVGHTGNYEATCKAVKITDDAIGMIYKESIERGFTLIITADHGNAEIMIDESGNQSKKHTKNRVPFIYCNGDNKYCDFIKDDNFSLKDIAPTILKHMEIKIPKEMTGIDLMDFYERNTKKQ